LLHFRFQHNKDYTNVVSYSQQKPQEHVIFAREAEAAENPT
jgi:hypothetical protein